MRTVSNPTIKRLVKPGLRHSALQIDPQFLPDLSSVIVTDAVVTCNFEEGHTVSFPIAWSHKLMHATPEQRQAFEFNAHFIFWDDIDEIIGVRNILFGRQLQWKESSQEVINDE